MGLVDEADLVGDVRERLTSEDARSRRIDSSRHDVLMWRDRKRCRERPREMGGACLERSAGVREREPLGEMFIQKAPESVGEPARGDSFGALATRQVAGDPCDHQSRQGLGLEVIARGEKGSVQRARCRSQNGVDDRRGVHCMPDE